MIKKVLACFFVIVLYCPLSFAQHYLLYGMTYAGGTNGAGTLFSYDLTTNSESVLLSFNNAGNGAKPYGNVVLNPADGFLYGVTSAGGAHNDGVIFSFDPLSTKDSVRLSFDSLDGKGPEYGGLTLYNNLLYGMTLYGGKYKYGTLFSFDQLINKDSVYTNFDTNGKAYYPAGLPLTPYSNGLMYGMTYAGGTYNRGTIISFDPLTGIYNVLVNLDSALGTYPIEGGFTLDPVNKLLYGLTYQGGTSNDGVVFCFNPNTGKDSVVMDFIGANGSQPYGSLMYDTANGLLYGMTSVGGANTGGVLFSFDPLTGKDSTIFSFNGANGAVPLGDLTLGPNNTLYGMTLYGGTSNLGVLFSYNTVTGKDSVLVNFTGVNGSNPYGSVILAKAPLLTNTTKVTNADNTLVYPNPCSTLVNLTFSTNEKHFLEVDDVTGREIIREGCNGKQYSLSLGNVTKGIYFIKAFDAGHTLISVSKVIVQ